MNEPRKSKIRSLLTMKYRTKSICFRLSDRELAHVRAGCTQENFASLSDYARSVLLQHSGGKRPMSGLLEDRLQAFAQELASLQLTLGEFLSQLESVKPKPAEAETPAAMAVVETKAEPLTERSTESRPEATESSSALPAGAVSGA